MDIPDWLIWATLGLTLLQALALVAAIRRTLDPDPALRSKARLDLLDTTAILLLMASRARQIR
ncbi:hypothetical protein ACIGO8_13025 [Streptomyces sp. NPDC053493]|uniref:hypothetical protein n=1 Tax=Streptomyces sp. NPDC053493 TaxID=3365705 RepID=UPI0037D432E7